MSLRAVNLAKIHIAKAQLGMDDDTYRALLARVAGVRSAKDLGPRQVGKVLAEFQRLGWKPKSNRQGRATPKVPQNRQTVLRKITALLASAQRPWSYADHMARRMFKVERVEWLDDSQLYRLMQALIIDRSRHGQV
ncbi:TPA: regulatory protein GemA [Pseudomonas aeruginosa]|uniref:gp16 family protein n=1 Tax=Pseudomonas TaxID=286 RepID=UPI000579FD7A|nr:MULTISPECIES: regulatory protein GemA [Pseudomonas]MBI8321502.1 regulatory protein GemA [Pseudomonas aeruginosa]MBX5714950.1 regulatory protein GemA [Pseudomonas aeruginosa]MBX6569651.1 regulatory protein GemA [Pseudomonas aeruginosa]MBX6793171.1 regulatory protein GemA [Pseudomonas aeruginosa]MBX6895247.1 regulatory protein GemA [Pseudomonas aeruginosa]